MKNNQETKSTTFNRNQGLTLAIKAAIAVGVVILVLGAIFLLNKQDTSSPTATGGGSSGSTNTVGKYVFQVGNPGPSQQAPPIRLPSTDGNQFDLASLRDKTVLLYFQEGVMCPPCWEQIKDIESNFKQFQALGIDQMISITTDPIDALKQKVADENLSTFVLSDPNLKVSETYDTNSYGMMGKGYNGHTFIAVGPDGQIQWRADYGGAPKYTMYVPVPNLIADLQKGLQEATQ